MPIGIIVWVVLICVIAICTSPGVLNFLAVILGIFCIGGIIVSFVGRSIGKRIEKDTGIDRERAIDEWEKKWGRPHPMRVRSRN